MNGLPAVSIAARFGAVAAVVTLTLLSGIDAMALAQSGGVRMAQAGASQPG